VLANDSLSESACVDPNLTILSVCGDGVAQPYEATPAGAAKCPDDSAPIGNPGFTPGGGVTYDAPDDGKCGFLDTFTYTVDLGGGVIDTATVRVLVACVCGDSLVDSNEQCDQGANNKPAGTVLDTKGTPSTADDVYARCSESCLFNVHCGDSYIVFPEECDDRNAINGDGCSQFCTLESVCGDGTTRGVEQCDDGNTANGDGCNSNCTVPACGDGNVDVQAPFGETCDDGNRALGDGCDSNCHVETKCGNDLAELGEDCDDGNLVPGDGCSAQCTVENVCGNELAEGDEVCDGADFGDCPVIASAQIQCTNEPANAPNICVCANYCGDGQIGGLEECDAGSTSSATCRASTSEKPCTLVRCGDAVVDTGEACDDGNTNPADGCTNDCKVVSICGNGTAEGNEECDDGNNVSGDGCSSACKSEATVCGDGQLDSDEQCDDGNTTAGDGCDAACLLEGGACGNGTRDLGEQCDDGNTMSGDGCSAACELDLCGNGERNTGEECDDGNTMPGDGCSSLCRIEVM
jgi:cysteine-rich repeat protein